MFIRLGPYSILGQNLASALIVWLLFGLTIFLVYAQWLNRETIVTYAGFLLVSLVYINLLRKKIDSPFTKKLIQTVVGVGYVLKDSHK